MGPDRRIARDLGFLLGAPIPDHVSEVLHCGALPTTGACATCSASPPITAPVGAFMRRIDGLLDHPDEVAGALAAGQVVIMGAEHDERLREVGRVDHALIGSALAAGVQDGRDPHRYTTRLAPSQRPRRRLMSYLRSSDGIRIHYRITGRPNGAPILFIQGLGADKNRWNLQRLATAP